MTRRAELRAAVIDLFPALVASLPLGLLYGALAVGKGMSPLEATLASLLIFAGSLQLASLELWAPPLPVAGLALTALLLNARYVLLGASLAPKLAHLPPPARALAAHALADENWALAERRAAAGLPLGATYVLGMGALFLANWVAATLAGTLLGPLLGDPARLGADFAFTAIVIGLVAGFTRSRGAVAAVVASAAAAVAAWAVVGAPWHILAGAASGMAAAALLHRPGEGAAA